MKEFRIFKELVIINGEGWHRREMSFLAKPWLTQPLGSQKNLGNLKYQLKNKYPPLAKHYKRIPFSFHTCPLPLL
jgi:hypothetical protein